MTHSRSNLISNSLKPIKPTNTPSVDQLQQALTELKAENYALKERVLAYEYQSEATEMNIFNTLKEKNLQINELQKECVFLREQNNNFEVELEELRQAIEHQRTELENLLKEKNINQLKLKKYEKEARELKTKCNDASQLREDNYNSYDQLRVYEEEITRSKKEYDDLENKLKRKYEKEINKLSDLIYCYEENAKNDDIRASDRLTAELKSQDDKFNLRFKQETENYNKAVDFLKQENLRLSEEIKQLKNRKESFDSRKDSEILSLKQELRRLTADAHKLGDIIDENQILGDKIETMQAKLDELANERNYLFEELQQREETASQLELNKDISNKEVNNCISEIKWLEDKISVLDSDIPDKKTSTINHDIFYVIEQSMQTLSEINSKTVKDYINCCNWSVNDTQISSLISHFHDMLISEVHTQDLKQKIIYNSLKNYLIDEVNVIQDLICNFKIVNETNVSKAIYNITERLEFLCEDIKYKSLCLTKFLLKLIDDHRHYTLCKSKMIKHNFLDLKDVYLDTYYFDEENREYLKNCVLEYARIRFAARKIGRFMVKIIKEKKYTKYGAKKNMDYCVFKAATGKMVLIELLKKISGVIIEVKKDLE